MMITNQLTGPGEESTAVSVLCTQAGSGTCNMFCGPHLWVYTKVFSVMGSSPAACRLLLLPGPALAASADAWLRLLLRRVSHCSTACGRRRQ